MKQKIILFFIALIAAFNAYAHYFSVDGISYTTNGNEATVYGSTLEDLVIPETVTYDGVTYPVTSIGVQAFKRHDNLTSVTIPSSIKSIEIDAFYECTNLKSVKIDNAPTFIGLYAFANCYNLTNVNLGNSVTLIDQGAFANCFEMMDVEIPNTVTSIGKYAFSSCVSMTNLYIPSSVTFIDKEAFITCAGLVRITVDNNNTHYDSRYFCNAIIETSTNTLIRGCSNTIIPSSVEIISDYAFGCCHGLKSVIIPNSVKSIGNYAFENCYDLTYVSIGNSVTSIGQYAFYHCSDLEHVSFGKSVTTIGEYSFRNCSNLTFLNLPSSVTTIDKGAFESCSLRGLTINSDLTIGQYAFDSYRLTNFTIGKSVTTIDISSFGFGYELDSVICLATIPPTCISGFPDGAYWNCTLFVPEGSISAYQNADYWKDFYYITSITNMPVDPEQPSYYELVSIDGFMYQLNYSSDDPMYSGTATMLHRDYTWDIETGEYREYQIQYENWNTDSIFYIPAEISTESGIFKLTTIKRGFSGATDLKTVVIPPTITHIASFAFSASSIESIYFCGDNSISNSVPISFGGDFLYYDYVDHDDGNSIFRGCERLSTVVFEKPVNRLPNFTFKGCPELKSVCFSDKCFSPDAMIIDSIGDCAFLGCIGLVHFDVPNSVKVIGEAAFAHCNNLERIYLPSGLTAIEDYAFADCHQLDGISLSPSLKTIGKAAFINCWSLDNISIPDDITTIKAYSFYDCRNLTNLELNNVTIFEEHAFAGCDKLPSIDLTKAQSIGEAAFFTGKVICYIRTEPNYYSPYLVIAVSEEAWYPGNNEGSFKKIILGEDISVLNDRTFYGHIPDTIICMATTPPTFSSTNNVDWVFSLEANNTSVLLVPQVLVNDYREAYGWRRFKHIEGITIIGNGDVNGDNESNISDVTALIDMLLGSQTGTFNLINADVNGDGSINIADVTALIDKLLSSN